MVLNCNQRDSETESISREKENSKDYVRVRQKLTVSMQVDVR